MGRAYGGISAATAGAATTRATSPVAAIRSSLIAPPTLETISICKKRAIGCDLLVTIIAKISLHRRRAVLRTIVAYQPGSIGDLQDIVRAVRPRGAALKATEQPIDTSTAAGVSVPAHSDQLFRLIPISGSD